MSLLLDGTKLRDRIKAELSAAVSALPEDKKPGLCIIQIGDHDASSTYIRGKIKFGEEIGVPVVLEHLPENATQEEVVEIVKKHNADPKTSGILVQLPLPVHMNKDLIIETVDPKKDVDGLHSENVKKLWAGDPSGMMPATTQGVLSLLNFYYFTLTGKKVLMIGRSNLVGKPTAIACLNHDATVIIAHHHTADLVELCQMADIIITATGVPRLITTRHVKKDHVIIDIGTSRENGKLCGDVDFSEVFEDVAALTPVPGGVGPLTIACLFQNLLKTVDR